MFKRICVPLMLINNNVYTFVSGILLSLSTGIFTTLCLEKSTFLDKWFLYLSSLLYLYSGAICIYIASKITTYQNYISVNKILSATDQKLVVCDFEGKRKKTWIIIFIAFFFTMVAGTGLLVLNFYI